MQQEYETSKTITARWAAITPTANTGQEDATLAEQTANRQRAARILDRYKTDIAQATFQTPPQYAPPPAGWTVDRGETSGQNAAGTSHVPMDPAIGGHSGTEWRTTSEPASSRDVVRLSGKSGASPDSPVPVATAVLPSGPTASEPDRYLAVSRPQTSELRPHPETAAPRQKPISARPGGSVITDRPVPPVIGSEPQAIGRIQSQGRPAPTGAAPAIVGSRSTGQTLRQSASSNADDRTKESAIRSGTRVSDAALSSHTANSSTTQKPCLSGPTQAIGDRTTHHENSHSERDEDGLWMLPTAVPSVIDVSPAITVVIDPGPAIGR
jgi:hypothetical protein